MTAAEVIARLEAATGPDRELDAHIFCIVKFPHLTPERNFFYKNREEWGVFVTNQPNTGMTFHDAPRYTGSIDTAISLLPEYWDRWRVISRGIISCGVEIRRYEGHSSLTPDVIQAQAYTEPCAIVIAALKASFLAAAFEQKVEG